jgi:hypothetical protein
MFGVSFSSFRRIFHCRYYVYSDVEKRPATCIVESKVFWITVKMVCAVSCSSFHTVFHCRCVRNKCCSKIPTAHILSYFQVTVRSEFDIRHTSCCFTNCKRCGKMPNSCMFNLLKTKHNLFSIWNQSVPRCKHFPA